MGTDLDLNTIQSGGLPGFKFGSGNLGDVVSAAIPYIFTFGGIALLIYFLFGGFSLLLSRGDPKAIQAGKDKITHALIGFVVIFTAYWIVQFVGIALGLEDFGRIFGGGGSGGGNPAPFCPPGQTCPLP